MIALYRYINYIVQFPYRSARVAAVLALLGMAFNALWPLIANAEPRTEFFATEICSVSKSNAANALGKLPVQAPAQKHQAVHCVFCASGACNASLGGALPGVVALSTATEPVPRAAGPHYKSNHAFLFPESRAPPVSSLS